MTALLTDLYQLTMLQASLEEEMTATAVVKLIELVPALRRDGIARSAWTYRRQSAPWRSNWNPRPI